VAERIVEEVRRAFRNGVAMSGCRIGLTVSVGVAWYGSSRATAPDLIEAAERALSEAKAGGGDCLVEAL
jgi:GGDEF domain-containing protein